MATPAQTHADGAEELQLRLVERIAHNNIEASQAVLSSNGCRRKRHELAAMYRRNGDCRRRGAEDRRTHKR